MGRPDQPPDEANPRYDGENRGMSGHVSRACSWPARPPSKVRQVDVAPSLGHEVTHCRRRLEETRAKLEGAAEGALRLLVRSLSLEVFSPLVLDCGQVLGRRAVGAFPHQLLEDLPRALDGFRGIVVAAEPSEEVGQAAVSAGEVPPVRGLLRKRCGQGGEGVGRLEVGFLAFVVSAEA